MCRHFNGVWCLITGLVLAVAAGGCAALDAGDDREGSEVRQEVESQFGALDDDAIEGFERELATQYEQLHMTYDEYDGLRQGARQARTGDHEDHRLHLKLQRRHRTLARLHEERMWLHIDTDDREAARDRQLAQSHRAASQWHGDRFEDEGTGVEPQDDRLEMLREEFDRAGRMFAE